MDLQDFVAGSLTQIIAAIKKAQEDSAASGAWISPTGLDLPKSMETIEIMPGISAYLHDVEFDVAVTVGKAEGATAGLSLQVFAAKIGASGNVDYENAQVSRVKFSIPVVWPGAVRAEREAARAEDFKKQTAKAYAAFEKSPA